MFNAVIDLVCVGFVVVVTAWMLRGLLAPKPEGGRRRIAVEEAIKGEMGTDALVLPAFHVTLYQGRRSFSTYITEQSYRSPRAVAGVACTNLRRRLREVQEEEGDGPMSQRVPVLPSLGVVEDNEQTHVYVRDGASA